MQSRKMVLMNLFARQQWRNREHLWTWGEGREDEMYGESNMETYITMCNIDSRWEFAVFSFVRDCLPRYSMWHLSFLGILACGLWGPEC